MTIFAISTSNLVLVHKSFVLTILEIRRGVKFLKIKNFALPNIDLPNHQGKFGQDP